MGKLYKRGETYYADLRAEGKGRVSLHTGDRVVAKERLREAQLAKDGTAAGTKAPERSLAHAIDAMLALKKPATAASYAFHGQSLCRGLGEQTDINSLTRAQVSDYIIERRKTVKAHTVHKELVVLRQALEEAKRRHEFLGEVKLVVPSIKADYHEVTRWLTKEQFDALLASAPPERHTWLLLQVYTSSNKSETARIGWPQVDLAAGVVTIPGTKRRSRNRIVPLHEVLAAHLGALDRAQAMVQPWPGVNAWLRKRCHKLKLPHTSTNDLRRTFGSWLVQEGVDIVHVARLMGNTVEVAARVYGQHSRESLRAAIDRLPGASPKAWHTPGTASRKNGI